MLLSHLISIELRAKLFQGGLAWEGDEKALTIYLNSTLFTLIIIIRECIMEFGSLPLFTTFKPQFMASVGCTICILCNELKSERGIE